MMDFQIDESKVGPTDKARNNAYKAIADAMAQFVFKSSFDKANRTSVKGKRGIGMEEGLKVLENVRTKLGVPVLTDIHTEEQATSVGQVVDVLQIPAFLCRQTDMIVAGAEGFRKEAYRRFNIRGNEEGVPDDFAAMEEVLGRRMKQWEAQQDLSPHDPNRNESFAALPNVVVIDATWSRSVWSSAHSPCSQLQTCRLRN